jgi:hypothetical protein
MRQTGMVEWMYCNRASTDPYAMDESPLAIP